MKAATKTQRPKHQEEHTNFTSWRFVSSCGYILPALAFLLGRVAWLRVISPDMLVKESDMCSLHVQRISASCGMTTDRPDRPSAMNVSVKAIWVDPKEMHDAGGINVGDRWKALTNALNIPLDQPPAYINANLKRYFIYLAHQANPNMADHIKKLKLSGVHLCKKSCRYYPSGGVIAHFISSTNVGNQEIEGVEKSFGKWLTEQPGECIMRRDHYGRVIEDISSTDSQAAHSLTLSTDERLQALVYHELNDAVAFNKTELGSTALVDVNTGEVPTMASNPPYNLNNLSGTPKEAMCSRIITDVLRPGSTAEPIMVMTVLQRGVVRENSVPNTVPYRVNGREIKDVARYSELTLTGVLQKPSSVGVSKLALAMPSSVLVNAYSRFRLKKVTNLGLVGEHSGLHSQK